MARQAQQQVSKPNVQTGNAVDVFRRDLSHMESQFGKMLPAHIPAERFARIIMNAVQRTPRLLMCDRQSLWNACMASAEDGLLPDKREGAIVPFKKGKDDEGGSVGNVGDYVAVWIPMVFGIRKLVRNSGLIRDLNVQLVYVDEFKAGKFVHELGDTPMLKHQRMAFDGDPAARPVYCGYSIAWDKDNQLLVPEVMFENEIMAVARRSKSFKAGPWSDPLFALEMRKKTVTKRHFKQLPTDRDLDRVLRRDDALYNFEDAERKRQEEAQRIRGGAKGALEHFAAGSGSVHVPAAEEEPAKEDTSGAPDASSERAGAVDGREHREPTAETKTKDRETPTEAVDSANAKTVAEYEKRFLDYLKTAKATDAIEAKWKREIKTRNGLNMEPDKSRALEKAKADRIAELKQ